MPMSDFYIQYHNADKLGYFPGDEINFNTSVKDITLKSEEDDDFWIYTSKKKSVERSIGSRCFLIVGKTENKLKIIICGPPLKFKIINKKITK